MLAKHFGASRLHSWEKVRMVTDFAKLHQHVLQLFWIESTQKIVIVEHGGDAVLAREDACIQFDLQFGEADLHVDFDLIWQLDHKLILGASKHEWLQNFVQHLHVLDLLVIILLIKVELICEVLLRREELRHKEVQETPQLTNIILEWRARQQYSGPRHDIPRILC